MTNPTSTRFIAAASLMVPLFMAVPTSAAVSILGVGSASSQSTVAQPAGVCSRRAGPFATQTTAFARRRQAISRGFQVSNVFPNGGGYAFNVFFFC